MIRIALHFDNCANFEVGKSVADGYGHTEFLGGIFIKMKNVKMNARFKFEIVGEQPDYHIAGTFRIFWATQTTINEDQNFLQIKIIHKIWGYKIYKFVK